MPARPLLVFDTNILLDVLLGRGREAGLLVSLAESSRVDLIVPEYVLHEFQGTARRWIREERRKIEEVRRTAREWSRSTPLGIPATEILDSTKAVEDELPKIEGEITALDQRLRKVATVSAHTPEIHFRGDLRYLSGRPPDRPVEGLKDCRIYEAILDVAKTDSGTVRPRYLVTRDADFDFPELVNELSTLGFIIRSDPGRLYGELK